MLLFYCTQNLGQPHAQCASPAASDPVPFADRPISGSQTQACKMGEILYYQRQPNRWPRVLRTCSVYSRTQASPATRHWKTEPSAPHVSSVESSGDHHRARTRPVCALHTAEMV